MMKFVQKMDMTRFKIQCAAFVWILICNIIVQILHEPLLKAGIPSWTIFLANVLFFIKDNKNQKEGLAENVCGAVFGLLGAFCLVKVNVLMQTNGAPALAAVVVPLTVFLFLTIALHPMLPYVFNNIALCFFLVALIDMSVAAGPLGHIIGVLIGNAIVNVGVILIVGAMIRRAQA